MRLKEKKEFMKIFRDQIAQCARDSTVHSVPHIIKSKNHIIRSFWIVCFFAFSALCSFMISKSFENYFSYDTVTKYETIYEIPTRFPAISFCNQNPLMTTFAFDYVKSFLDANNLTDLYAILAMNYSTLIKAFRYGIGINLKGANVSDDFRKKIGLNIDDMLFSCVYNNQPCSSKDFVWYFDSLYGSCYTFNSGKNANGTVVALVNSTRSGSFNGLILELYVGEPTNIYSLSYTSGALVIVNNQTSKPLYNDGYGMNVGTYTNIEIRRKFSSRLEHPYSDCMADISPDTSIYVQTLFEANYTYTQAECFNVCLQKYVVLYCNCYSQEYPYWNSSHVEPCQSLAQLSCYGILFVNFFSQDINVMCPNECPLECDAVTYTASLSATSYPSLVYANILQANAQIRARFGNETTNVSLDDLRSNILAVNVYYADLSYQLNSEKQKMSYGDLVASIGGTLGLFLGMSFLSFLEIIDFIFNFSLAYFSTVYNI